MNLEFTAKDNSDYIYMVIWEYGGTKESLEFLNDDEFCEVTPESIRLRKQILNKSEREKAAKKRKVAAE